MLQEKVTKGEFMATSILLNYVTIIWCSSNHFESVLLLNQTKQELKSTQGFVWLTRSTSFITSYKKGKK